MGSVSRVFLFAEDPDGPLCKQSKQNTLVKNVQKFTKGTEVFFPNFENSPNEFRGVISGVNPGEQTYSVTVFQELVPPNRNNMQYHLQNAEGEFYDIKREDLSPFPKILFFT